MGDTFYNQVDILLNGTKSQQGKALKLIARGMDEKFSEAAELAAKQQREILKAIETLKTENVSFQNETRDKFKALEVVSFFATHKQIFLLVLVCLCILAGVGGYDLILKIF